MGKLLLILLLVVLAVFWLRHKALAQRDRRDHAPGAPAAPAAAAVQKMVSCARCGLNVPQPDAARGLSGRDYCGFAHRAMAGDGPS